MKEHLLELGLFSGFLVIVEVICGLYDVPRTTCYKWEFWIFVGGATLLILHWSHNRAVIFLVRQLNRVPAVYVWGLCVALSIGLIISHRHRRTDAWMNWGNRTFRAMGNCKTAGDDSCIAQALSTVPLPQMEVDPHQPLGQLNYDLRIGATLLQDQTARDRVHQWFGIDEHFIGTGFSLPVGTDDYWQERVPEFLVPNYPDSQRGVWIWRVDPYGKEIHQTLEQLIYSLDPIEVQFQTRAAESLKQDREELRRRLSKGDQPVPVVRFAQITRREYSGCLGPKARRRVFASELRPLMALSLDEGTKYSGYSFNPAEGETEKKLYVMVLLPEHPADVVPATWGEIHSNLMGWINAAVTCPQ